MSSSSGALGTTTSIPLPVLPTIEELLGHPVEQDSLPASASRTAMPPKFTSSNPVQTQTGNLPLHSRLLTTPPQPQPSSPLFSILPPEVRSEIFSLALADYPDPSPNKHYEATTCYTRPSYFAPRRTDWALLATCRLAYAEAWHLPFTLREQTHWLTAQDRAPPGYPTGHVYSVATNQRRMLARSLEQIRRGLGGDETFEIEGLRVFAQMYKLENGSLATLLGTPGLRPRRVTLTLRHTDWWFWEEDQPLRIEGQLWLSDVCQVLPASVREFCVELESLERRSDQVDEIARQMRAGWFFKRMDGEGLFPDMSGRSDNVTRWSGTSTWNRERWVRDETAEGRLDYYVRAVPFRPLHVVERNGGCVSKHVREDCEKGSFMGDKLKLVVPWEMKNTPPGGATPVSPPTAAA